MKSKEFLYFLSAIILLTIVSADIYWWISIASDNSKTFKEVQSMYHQKFPEFLRNGKLITFINIILLAAATFLFIKTSSVFQLKKVSLGFMIISSLLAIWQIFTLM
jgi:hypothetical protein